VHVRERFPYRRRLERRMRAVTREHFVERARVAPVRDEREQPAGPQHALDLAERSLRVEPVERLRDRDGIGRGVRERDRLRGSVQRLDPRGNPRTHLDQGLNGDDARTRRHELPRELPGAGCKIHDDAARPEAELLDEERHRLRRVARPRTLVGVSRARKRGGS